MTIAIWRHQRGAAGAGLTSKMANGYGGTCFRSTRAGRPRIGTIRI